MAAVRSRRFFGPVVLVAATTTLVYTVPAGRTAIFHTVVVINTAVAAGFFDLRVNGTLNVDRAWLVTVPATDSLELFDRIILNPGDTLYARSGVGATMAVSGYGSLLDGAPS